MTNARWFIAVVLLALTLPGATVATAQVVVQVEDLIGTWELVSTKDLKTGAAVYGIEDASTGIQCKPRHDLHYIPVHFSRPYPVRTNSNSTNCCVETDLGACRRRVCGRYNTNDSWGVSGMSAPCGEAKRVG